MANEDMEIVEQEKYVYFLTPTHYSSINLTEGTIEYEIHLPGVKKEEIKLKLLRDLFDLQAKIDENSKYSLSHYFPYDIDENSIEASYENGLLKFKAKIRDPLAEAYNIKLE